MSPEDPAKPPQWPKFEKGMRVRLRHDLEPHIVDIVKPVLNPGELYEVVETSAGEENGPDVVVVRKSGTGGPGFPISAKHLEQVRN